MADEKISALVDGGSVADGDQFVVARSGSDYKIAGSSVLCSPATFITRVAGDLTLTNDGAWHDVPTIGDLTIAAGVSDILMVSLNCVTDKQCYFDVELVNSGSYIGNGDGASSQGIAGMSARTGASAGNARGSAFWTVVSGDISGGNVVLRLRYNNNSQSTKIFADSTVGPFQFGVINLKH